MGPSADRAGAGVQVEAGEDVSGVKYHSHNARAADV